MLLGLTFAILASLGSGVGSAVEAFGVRRAAAKSRKGSLGALLHEPVYFIGLTVDLLGFVFTVIALQILPLFLVQAVVASSVGVTALIVAASGRTLGRPGGIALGASVTGLVLLSISSQAHDVPPLSTGWHWLLLGLALPLAGLGALATRISNNWSAVLLAFTAGLAFTCVAVSARSLDVPDPAWQILLMPAVWAIIVNGLLGTVLFALALQRGKVTVVAAVTFTTNTVLPSIIGIFLLGDQVRSGYALVATAGFLISVSGAIALAQFAGPLPAPTHPNPSARRAADTST
jgi:drug/metabolite transporter (DMT)-like permease